VVRVDGITDLLDVLPLLAETKGAETPARAIRIFDGKAWSDARLLHRQTLGRQRAIAGPALLEDPTSTLYLPAGWTARSDENDNTILERQ
jgi:N-methylhydantoinase A